MSGKTGTYIYDERLRRMVRKRRITRDRDKPCRSLKMGCPKDAEQQRRLALFEKNGIDGCSYDPATAELCFPPGLDTQKRLAKLHGFEVG